MTIGDRIRLTLVTGLGAGLIPVAPGTFGTVMGVLLYIPIAFLPEPCKTGTLALVILGVCALTVGLGNWAEEFFGGKDPQRFVLDEVAGILLTLTLFRGEGVLWLTLLWAFPLFRAFDIIKLPPARQAEKLPKGWGVLVDDLISGCYAAALLWAVYGIAPWLFGYQPPTP